MPNLNEVFGVGVAVPKYTYVNRSGLDEKFKYLLSAERHIVIHGSSKQGKTILRKKKSGRRREHCCSMPLCNHLRAALH
jgi:hypothetical protein